MRRAVTRLIRHLRRGTEAAPETTVPHAAMGELLVFGQQHLGTQSLFQEVFGQAHTIPLCRCPHYELLARHLNEEFADTSFYSRYLQASWAYRFPEMNTPERRRERIEEFKSVYRNIESRRHLGADAIITPVKVCRRPDGRLIVVKGNHRASAALKLGLDLKVVMIAASTHLRKQASIAEAAPGQKGLLAPHSVFWGEGELVEGRDRLGLQRLKAIRAEDLSGRHIVELGCSIGTHCFLAAQFGATSVTGLDANHRAVSAAIRVNAFMAADGAFLSRDAATRAAGVPAQTLLCFSMAEVITCQQLVRQLVSPSGAVLYFENADGTSLEEYRRILPSLPIGRIEPVCELRSEGRARTLFRCELS